MELNSTHVFVRHIVMGAPIAFEEVEGERHFYLKKKDRILVDLPFDFLPGTIGETEVRNVPSPIGRVSTIMYQVINKSANRQLSFKVMDECLVDLEVRFEGRNLFLELKEEYAVTFVDGMNLIICKSIEDIGNR